MNVVRKNAEDKGKPLAAPSGCLAGDCSSCAAASHCSGHSVDKKGEAE